MSTRLCDRTVSNDLRPSSVLWGPSLFPKKKTDSSVVQSTNIQSTPVTTLYWYTYCVSVTSTELTLWYWKTLGVTILKRSFGRATNGTSLCNRNNMTILTVYTGEGVSLYDIDGRFQQTICLPKPSSRTLSNTFDSDLILTK